MRSLLLLLVLAACFGCAPKEPEPTAPAAPLPESAGGQKLSYQPGGK